MFEARALRGGAGAAARGAGLERRMEVPEVGLGVGCSYSDLHPRHVLYTVYIYIIYTTLLGLIAIAEA